MPLGEIKPRELTPEEARWQARWKAYEGMSIDMMIYPLYQMSRKEYFAFMYFIDPRLALIMSQEPQFKEILEYQRDKPRWRLFVEYVREKFNAR